MTHKLTRREFQFRTAGTLALGAGAFSRNPLQAKQPASGAEKARGIVKVTRGPRLGSPPSAPPGRVWHYMINYPFQVAPGLAATSCNIKESYVRGHDFENGLDILLFSDHTKIDTRNAVTVTRFEDEPNPYDGGRIATTGKWPCPVGFVPYGAKRSDASPHPHAGTGFGLSVTCQYPLVHPGQAYPNQREKVFQIRGDKYYSYFELFQYAYDGKEFKIISKEKVADKDLLPGTKLAGGGLTNAIPDGDDLLMPMESGTRWKGSRSGLMRWQRRNGRWRPVAFHPVTDEDDSIEASVIRDVDGEFLFCARTQSPSFRDVHPIRVWKSGNQGQTWQLVLFAAGISSAPVTLNQATDGTPYIAANRYTYSAHITEKGLPSIEYFREPDGRVRQSKGTRETLALWPLNEARDGLESPLIIRDGLGELGTPPNGTWWGIDHPSAMTLRLGDSRWHNLIGYRTYEKAEMTGFVTPTLHTGAYLEEVISSGKPIPTWNF